MVVWPIVAPMSAGTRRWRCRAALLLFVILPAGCRPGTVPAGPAGDTTAVPALTTRDLPADSSHEASLDVGLDALSGGAPAPGGQGRNPFRFGRETLPSLMPAGDASGGNSAVLPGAVDGWRPAEEMEAIRFLGIVEAAESIGLVAVLVDDGGVYHGRVNEVVGGRYRIVALDRTSIVIERVGDGERRTLRPSGY